ncbi:MAG: FG-GAP-like repeat-containing protein [Planctomycetota bacterium]|nr:FG-GAP-like repeat-containing protein [Planctomycetota bacterium]
MISWLLFAATALAIAPVDDVIPSSIEAVLATPDDPIAFGLPLLLEAQVVTERRLSGTGRCAVDLGDVNGDGLADYAVGVGPDGRGKSLWVLDGTTNRTIWSASPGKGSFRSLRGLSHHEGRLALGVSSPRGLVQVRDTARGQVVWSRSFAPASREGAHVSSVRWGPDLNADGQRDLLVAGGGGIESAMALSGTDGSTLWEHTANDVVMDALAVHDQDEDGLLDILVVGGETAPFARLLSGLHGAVLWEQSLDGVGSVGMGMDDINGDGQLDVVVGQFAEPAACVLALDGASGSRLWGSQDVTRNVTSLALVGDNLGTGFRDVAVGSFDNAVSVVLGFNGNTVWRREVSTFNGGSMLSVIKTADLDGNGSQDVLASSLDHRIYLYGGTTGQFMAMWKSGQKLAAVATLGDITGDGRPEVLAGGSRVTAVLDGSMGLASGPQLDLEPPTTLDEPLGIILWSYPGTQVILWASLGTDANRAPGAFGIFGLDLSSLVTLYQGPTPGAGGVTLAFDALPPSAAGLAVWLQAVSIYSPSHAILSNVNSFHVPVD